MFQKIPGLFILMVLITLQSFSQFENVKSILQNDSLSDSLKLDSAFKYLKKPTPNQILFFDSILNKNIPFNTSNLQQLSILYVDITQYDLAIKYFIECEDLAYQNQNIPLLVSVKNKHAQILRRKGNFDLSISIYEENIELINKHKITEELSLTLLGMGFNYRDNNKLDLAAKYYKDALKASNTYNNSSLNHTIIHELGNIYALKNNFDSALIYQLKALELRKQLNEKFNLLISYNDIGDVYLKSNQIANALKMFNKAESLAIETNNAWALATILLNKGDAFQQEKKYNLALKSIFNSLKKSKKNKYHLAQKYAFQLISDIYRKQQKYDSALFYHDSLMILNDTIQNKKTNTLLEELNAKYELSKKDNAIIQHKSKLKRNRITLYFLVLGLIISTIFLFIIFRLLTSKRLAYKELNIKNKLTEEQKEEISRQSDILKIQQKHILDGINYARYLQNSILPTESKLNAFFNDYFLIYKPLEIIGGDFYQLFKHDDIKIVIVADCTGHGVPGALMSMLGASSLNEIINHSKVFNAAQILEKLKLNIKSILLHDQSKKENIDGMDIGILVANAQTNEYHFAGARHSLVYFENNNLLEITGDKQPIGSMTKEKPFTNHYFTHKESNQYYMFTDGLADQFNATTGKKFLKKRVLTLLNEINADPMKIQRQKIETAFNHWKQDHEQIDDVLMLGFQF